eukprot:SAG31_NODE_45418_length_259_cov_0.618750_1_plen_61_part_10
MQMAVNFKIDERRPPRGRPPRPQDLHILIPDSTSYRQLDRGGGSSIPRARLRVVPPSRLLP